MLLLAIHIAQLSLSVQRSTMPADLLIIAHVPHLPPPKNVDEFQTETLIIPYLRNPLKPEILISS